MNYYGYCVTVNVPETVKVATPSPFGAVVLTFVPGAKDIAGATADGYLTITIPDPPFPPNLGEIPSEEPPPPPPVLAVPL
jgi:hypothetical protein